MGTMRLSAWIKKREDSGWFLDVSDVPTQQEFKQILQNVYSADYSEKAKKDFFEGADPWLIAKAKVMGATLYARSFRCKRQEKGSDSKCLPAV